MFYTITMKCLRDMTLKWCLFVAKIYFPVFYGSCIFLMVGILSSTSSSLTISSLLNKIICCFFSIAVWRKSGIIRRLCLDFIVIFLAWLFMWYLYIPIKINIHKNEIKQTISVILGTLVNTLNLETNTVNGGNEQQMNLSVKKVFQISEQGTKLLS